MATRTILIIDDEADFCALVKEHLELKGDFVVYTATSGEEGIAIAKKRGPDIILLDIRMPEMDGFEVLKRLKKDKDTMSIPVIMLTGVESEEAKLTAAGLFNELYMTKPVKFEELQNGIEKVLKRRGLG